MPALSSEFKTGDLLVLTRAMGFLDYPPSGIVELGILYSPAVPSSKEEAAGIVTLLGSSHGPTGSLTLRPAIVALEQLANSPPVALLVPQSMTAHANQVAAILAGKRTLTVSSQADVVTAGLVTMAVRTQPRVEIFVSRAAAQLAGIGFSPAFRMMIQER